MTLPNERKRRKRFDNCSLPRLLALCNDEHDYLVHLYWPQRVNYFEENLILLKEHERWFLVATPGHGLRGTQRPSLNFIVPGKEFVDHYPSAARARGFCQGVLIRRAAIEKLSNKAGYEMAGIKVVRHPNALRDHHTDDDWKYDIGKRRYGALHELRYAPLIRLATPKRSAAKKVLISGSDIVAWWRFPIL